MFQPKLNTICIYIHQRNYREICQVTQVLVINLFCFQERTNKIFPFSSVKNPLRVVEVERITQLADEYDVPVLWTELQVI